MALDVLIQMDALAGIDIRGDSSFAMLLEAQRRGHRIACYEPRRLSLRGGEVRAWAAAARVRDEVGNHFAVEAERARNVGEADVVLMRQDPPFDMGYISATYLLERAEAAGALVVNPPAAVRDAPEKLLVMDFPQLMPETLVTADAGEAREFQARHGEVIVKPLYGNGGAGVFHIGADGVNLNALLDLFADVGGGGGLPLVVQAFLPEVRDGDKRILLVDGEAVGCLARFPPAGEVRANMHVGGRAEVAAMDARDKEICAVIGPELRRRGLLFAGIDVIGGRLIEINVTSPTGIREIASGGGVDVASVFWDAVEARVG